jgi:hypothetical protein
VTPRNPDAAKEWGREIRGWLIGRLGKSPATGESRAVESMIAGRVRNWWTFDGTRHAFLGGTLIERAAEADLEARRLEAVLSPEWRVEASPAAETDWSRTALLQPLEPSLRFVVRASSSGLTEGERQALSGWREYTVQRWREYVSQLDEDRDTEPRHLPWDRGESGEEITDRHLHRWAHAARRSRWPFLREVVAETLRAALEPVSLDQLPLPSAPEALFELLCIVRLLEALAEGSYTPRLWINRERDQFISRIEFPGFICRHQGWLGNGGLSDDVLGGPCVRAIERHGVILPRLCDVLVSFAEPRAGFHGILVEAKSGDQSFADTVHQLKAYLSALRKSGTADGPFLVWGVVEGGGGRTKPFDADALRDAAKERAEREDLWLFTSEGEIGGALTALGLAKPHDASSNGIDRPPTSFSTARGSG